MITILKATRIEGYMLLVAGLFAGCADNASDRTNQPSTTKVVDQAPAIHADRPAKQADEENPALGGTRGEVGGVDKTKLADESKSIGNFDSPSKVVLAYLSAIASSDWRTICLTRIPSERQEMARMGGSCEKGFMAVLEGRPVSLFGTLEVRDVRIGGELASVDLAQPGQTELAMTMVARKTQAGWLLEDLPDGAGP